MYYTLKIDFNLEDATPMIFINIVNAKQLIQILKSDLNIYY